MADKVDVLADLRQARAALSQNATYPADLVVARNAIERVLVTVEQVVAERDALLETLRRYQDGRVFSNLHTRQVARAIEQEAGAEVAQLADAAARMLPARVCLDNTNVSDSVEVPLVATMGELRSLRTALAAATPKAGDL